MKYILIVCLLLGGCTSYPEPVKTICVSGMYFTVYEDKSIGLSFSSYEVDRIVRTAEEWDLINKKIQELAKIEEEKK